MPPTQTSAEGKQQRKPSLQIKHPPSNRDLGRNSQQVNENKPISKKSGTGFIKWKGSVDFCRTLLLVNIYIKWKCQLRASFEVSLLGYNTTRKFNKELTRPTHLLFLENGIELKHCMIED